MRGGGLAIKTLDGLQGVDVLLRRVPGVTLDPLELSVGGPGVTGLLDAARNGRVLVLNHPGAAVVEGLSAFMPALAERLLGEALLLPACPAAGAGDGDAGWAASLAPCYGPERLEPQPIVLRLFLMHDGSGWRMLQGGLARVLGAGERVAESVPAGAVLKDVWVLNEEGGFIQGPAPAIQAALPVRRSAGNLPSRVAEELYWLGRRVERLDGQARVGRAGLVRRARGAPLPREIAELQVLGRCLRAAGLETEEPRMPIDDQLREALRPRGSIDKGLTVASRLIEALRDRMTIETHGAFSHAMRAARADVADAPQDGIDGLVHAMSGLQRLATTVSGVSAEGMVRGGGRLFLELGRRVERAMVVGKVLGTALDQPPARLDGTLRLLLELSDSVITYRSRYLSVLQPVPVLDLVLIDPGNPRSLAFQFSEAAALLEQAGDADLAGAARDWVRRVQDLMDGVAGADDVAGTVTEAGARLIEIGEAASAMSERIARRFFALLPKLQSVRLEVA